MDGAQRPAVAADDGRGDGHVAEEQLFAIDGVAALARLAQRGKDVGDFGAGVHGVGDALGRLHDGARLGLGQGGQVGAARCGAIHGDTAADRHVHRHELRAHEAGDVDHLALVGLGETGGLGGHLGQFGQEGVGHVDEGVGGQVVEADLHGRGRQLIAAGLGMLAQVAEVLQRIDHALGRTLVDAGDGGHLGDRHGAALRVEGAQHGQPFLQRLVEQQVGSVVGLDHGSGAGLAYPRNIDPCRIAYRFICVD